ncbi:mucin-13 [Apodemus sylvaticus]|uniref:mucin-13 n=1 Tax=Apodemus sylvaticus TaxID=10129 RepID=UPI0022433D53|nr:mucin-13 [Apodemus sylvaticus]
MKGLLLLSLGILLVISGSSSQNVGTTQASSSSSSTTTAQTPTTGGSPQPSVTTQPPGGASSPATGQTPSTGGSSQPSVTTQPPGGASSPATGQSPSTGGSSQPSVTTQPPGGAGSSTVTSTGKSGPSDPCNPNPCEEPASCFKLHSSHFCLCLEGYYYSNSSSPSCVKGKTFPGEISMSVTETAELEDKNSVNYQKLHNYVVDFFAETFNQPDFGQTIILKVSTTPSMSARSAMQVYVSVVNMFREDTTEIEYTVSLAIHNAIEKDDIVESYFSQNLCDYYGCVRNGSFCEDGLQCTCKPGLDRLNPQVPFCVAAVTCSEPCNAEDKKQCVKSNSGPLECVCMPGYQRASGNGNCEECPFGYSGVDCKDQFQLILTIVGTVGGALILILLISFIVTVRSMNKKKKVEEQKLNEEDRHNLRQTSFSNYGADNSIFPKVRTGVQNQTPNPAKHARR